MEKGQQTPNVDLSLNKSKYEAGEPITISLQMETKPECDMFVGIYYANHLVRLAPVSSSNEELEIFAPGNKIIILKELKDFLEIILSSVSIFVREILRNAKRMYLS